MKDLFVQKMKAKVGLAHDFTEGAMLEAGYTPDKWWIDQGPLREHELPPRTWRFVQSSGGVDQAFLFGDSETEHCWAERVWERGKRGRRKHLLRDWCVVYRKRGGNPTHQPEEDVEEAMPLAPVIAGPFPNIEGAMAHMELISAGYAPATLPDRRDDDGAAE